MTGQPESDCTQLAYLGKREHIYAVDVFAAFESFALSGLPGEQRPEVLRSFKMIREVRRDGHWRMGRDAEEPSASVEWRTPAGMLLAQFVEDGELITARGPDNPRRVSSLDPEGSFSGRALLRPPTGTPDLLLGLVQANKGLHVHALQELGLPHDKIRMIYVEGLPFLAEPDSSEVELEFNHKGRRKMGERTYTLAEVRLPGSQAPLRLCFSC